MRKNYWLSNNPILNTYFRDWFYNEANIHKIKNHPFFKMLLHEPNSLNEKDVLIIKKFIFNISKGLSEIEKELQKNEDTLKELISRLISRDDFYSAYSEMILYIYFKRKNIQVQFYPSLQKSRKKSDFKINIIDRWINVELKTPYISNKIKSKETFRDMIMKQIEKLPFPYIIAINCSKVPSDIERRRFLSWLKSEFKKISHNQKFPVTLSYPDTNSALIDVHIVQRLEDTEHTLVGGYGYGTYGLNDSSRLKKLILKKTRGQISTKYPNLIIIDLSHSDILPLVADSTVNHYFSKRISAILIFKDNPFSLSSTSIISWVFPNQQSSNPLSMDELNSIGEIRNIN